MPRVEVVAAEPGHIPPIAAAMRQADRDEVWAAAAAAPEEALRRSLAQSPLAWTGLVDGMPVCMFGAAASSVLAGHACPWLLATDAVEGHAIAFLRRNRRHVRLMLQAFGRLSNRVDARNALALRWLGWLGFSVGPPEPFGPLAMPFHPFELSLTDRGDPWDLPQPPR